MNDSHQIKITSSEKSKCLIDVIDVNDANDANELKDLKDLKDLKPLYNKIDYKQAVQQRDILQQEPQTIDYNRYQQQKGYTKDVDTNNVKRISMGTIVKALIFLLFTITVYVIIMKIIQNGRIRINYRKIINTIDPEAKCLDGSSPALYIHQGGDRKRILIHIEGGGWCNGKTINDTLQNCYLRSKMFLGTSTTIPDYINSHDNRRMFLIYGITELDQDLYRNWTKIIIHYCDGAMYQGNSKDPIQYKDTKLYFRGGPIMRANLKWLQLNYQIDQAQKLLFVGISAGGIGSILWASYIRKMLKNPSAFYHVADSGAFFNSANSRTNTYELQTTYKNLIAIANKDEKTPLQECNNRYPGQEWKCFFFQYNNEFLKGKTLVMQSFYDAWQLIDVLKIECVQGKENSVLYHLSNCSPEQIQKISNFGRSVQHSLEQMQKARAQNNQTALWATACSLHGLSVTKSYNHSGLVVPPLTGISVEQAIRQFVFEDKFPWLIGQSSYDRINDCS